MKKEILLAFLCLFAVSFAAESAQLPYDGPLYTTNTPASVSDIFIDPYMQFTSTVQLSVDPADVRVIYGNPADLPDDGIVCEGQVTAQMRAEGIWARGGNLEQNTIIYQCTPEPNTRVSGNRRIEWSTSIYDTLISEEVCNEDESCWGATGSGFVSQPANYRGTAEWFNDRDSSTKVVCKGTYSLRRGTTLLSESVVESGMSPVTSSYSRGSYTFNGQMNVNGCMAILRQPACPEPGYVGREKIYGRTAAAFGTGAPQYSGIVGPATINLRVVTDDDLRCSAEFVSVVPSPLEVPPAGSESVTLNFRNPCPASDHLCQNATISGITVSDGFTFSQGMTIIGGNTVAPGRTRAIAGTLRAPDYTTCPAQLTFTARYSCPGCTGNIDGTPVSITVPHTCNLTLERDVNLKPRFDPDLSRYEIPTGENPNLTIITWNNGREPGNPGETCIRIGHIQDIRPGPFGPPTSVFLDDFPAQSYFYPALAGGEQYGRPLDFDCTPAIENNTYLMLVNVDCTDTTLNETDEFDNDDQRFISCVPPGTPTNETGDDERYRCSIDPPGPQTGVPGNEYDFGLDCTMFGADVDCPNAHWTYDLEGNATVSEEGPDSNTAGYWIVLGTDAREGSVNIEAKITFPDGNATCDSLISIPLIPCEEFV